MLYYRAAVNHSSALFLLDLPDGILAPFVQTDVIRRFSPFLHGRGKLPVCAVHFHKHLLSLASLSLLGNIGSYQFYAYTDRLLIFDGVSQVLVRNNQQMDVYVSDDCNATELSTLMMHGYQYVALFSGSLLLHSACVDYAGTGVAFCGIPGAGKSTQAKLWQQHLSADALNNDQPGLVFEEQTLYICGSPWSGKEPCYINRSIPLQAIVFVEQAEVNEMMSLSAAESYTRLFLNNYLFPFCPEVELTYAQILERITNAVPCWLLRCTISEAAVQVAFSTIYPGKEYRGVPSMKYKASKNFELKSVAGDWLLIPRGTFSINYSSAIVFNDTGAFLWQQLADYTTQEALTSALADKYNLDSSVVAADVSAFLSKMKENQMLEEG